MHVMQWYICEKEGEEEESTYERPRACRKPRKMGAALPAHALLLAAEGGEEGEEVIHSKKWANHHHHRSVLPEGERDGEARMRGIIPPPPTHLQPPPPSGQLAHSAPPAKEKKGVNAVSLPSLAYFHQSGGKSTTTTARKKSEDQPPNNHPHFPDEGGTEGWPLVARTLEEEWMESPFRYYAHYFSLDPPPDTNTVKNLQEQMFQTAAI